VVDPDVAMRLVERGAAPSEPRGDLLQAGPLLVVAGKIVFDADIDYGGFSAGAGQFDSDITVGRHPRVALGISDESLVAVARDGRRSSTAAARRRWCIAATSSTGPTPARINRHLRHIRS
jgi:hypothetical protein